MTLTAVVAMMTMVPPGLASEDTALPPETQIRVANTLQSAPIMFIENVGQSADGARSQVHGGRLLVRQGKSTAGPDVTTRVSVTSDGSQGNDASVYPSISADGRYVAFDSYASNLVSGDTNGLRDIFVHDRQTGQTARVSVASDGTEAHGGSVYPSISADGRYVAFYSGASNLVSDDTNGWIDTFVHDRQTGQTARVSVASDGSQGNDASVNPSISADGRYVAFDSYASNLVSGDTNGHEDTFVHDRQTGQTARVSVASDGSQGNDASVYPSISADGRYMAFNSDASNLVSGDTNGTYDIFVHDRQTGQTARVSVASDGSQGNNGSYSRPSISADGRYVAFDSDASNLVSGDTNGWIDIFVHDRQTGQTARVSVASDGSQGNHHSYMSSISADGRYVAFESWASNLVSGDTNGHEDTFVHDWQTGQMARVSVASDGGQGNDASVHPSISADGRYVAFDSWASNLVSGDTNGQADIFVHDREGGEAYSIFGYVRDGNGNPISGVTVSTGASGSATTDASGAYAITGLVTGAYTLTPSKSGWTFTPATRTVSMPPDATEQDFTGYDRPPIVLVHGFQGLGVPWNCDDYEPNNTFQQVDDFLSAAGYYTVFAYLETSPCYTPPLRKNVPNLKEAIEQAKTDTGQNKVILISHSMGGLVSRAYIEDKGAYDGDVAELFTFGSPHWGVPVDLLVFFANGVPLVEYCAEWQPAACEFSVLGMILFNRDHKKRPDVVYHLISGDAPNSSRNLGGRVTGAIIPGADDAIVPTVSGIGQAGIIDRLITDEVHGTGSGPRSYFIRDGGMSTSYTQCLKPVLVTKTTDTCGSVSPLQVTAATTFTPTARTPFEYGTLLAGQSVTRTISLEGGPTLFAAHWQTGTLAVTLVDPNDQTIDPAYAASHSDVVAYDADETAATYYFTDTIAGAWQ